MTGCQALPSSDSGTRVIAHRGSGKDFVQPDSPPENTLAALTYGWSTGADLCEVDCQVTSDQEVVLVHDATTKRTSDGNLAVSSHTLAQLRELDFGAWKGPEWIGLRIPTLSQALALIPPGKGLMIEIKVRPSQVGQIAEVVKQSGRGPGQIVFIAYNRDALRELKRLLPDYSCQQLAYSTDQGLSRFLVGEEQQTTELPWDELAAVTRLAGVEGLGVSVEAPLELVLEAARQNGLGVVVASVNTKEQAQQLADLDLWAISTDRPALVLAGKL
jgi:glycerophosphoryl diester phosphodiesterase